MWDKKVSMKSGIVPFTVRDPGGKIDQGASKRKFSEVLTQMCATEGASDDVVLGAINSVFDQYRGSNMNVAALASAAIQKMGSSNSLFKSPALFSTLSKRIDEVLAAHTSPKLAIEGDTKVYFFGVKSGVGGGHFRLADQAK